MDEIKDLLDESPALLAQQLNDGRGEFTSDQILYAMRLLCENEYQEPTYLEQLRSHSNQLVADCASAYSELEGMTDISKPYTRDIPFITKISAQAKLFRARSELFPRGALSLRDYAYVSKCWQRKSSFIPQIKILKVSSARSSVRCVYFYTCSQQYLSGLHDLLFLNASRFMQDGLVHIHVIGSGEPVGLLEKFELLHLPNVTVTYSEIDIQWSNRAAYYHAHRYLFLPLLLEWYRLPVMLLGSDTAFAQPAHELVSDSPTSIGLFFWNPRRRVPWKHIFADVVYFPYTQKGCIFAHAISNYLCNGDWDSGRLLYFDQVAVAIMFNYLSTSLGDPEVNDILPKLKSGVCNTNGGGTLHEKLYNGLSWINSELDKQSSLSHDL